MSRRWSVSGSVTAILWLSVRGAELTPQRLLEEFTIGLGVGVGIAFFFRRLYGDEAPIVRNLRVTPYATLHLTTLSWGLLTVNTDVAIRTLSPSMPTDSAVAEVPLRTRTPLIITTIANNIALAPGMLTTDHYDETNSLYVHSVNGSDPDDISKPTHRRKDYALVIFDEELKPGNPASQVEGGPVDGGDAPAATTEGEQRS